MTEIVSLTAPRIGESFSEALQYHLDEIQALYFEDDIPWVIGYSGGKDSTAVVQLVWLALEQLPKEKLHKLVYIISTDTLVENPVVSTWVTSSLNKMEEAALKAELPIRTQQLLPKIKDTFWVNLIGKGYPAPRPKFRWCTERLKIKPVDEFIKSVVAENGEAIVLLGTRKAESSVRAHRLNKYSANSTRDLLSKHQSIASASVYAPIADWSNDDVWLFLMQKKNSWGHNNKDLLTMYQGATEDGECPLVIDTTTPSCGSSRFGCWVCTLVSEDKSMTAMIQNDAEKIWMLPLLQLRNKLDEHDHDKRDFRRLNGSVQLKHTVDELIPGPYTQASREDWLSKLLEAQETVRKNPETPDFMKDINLITQNELDEIRRIWVVEKYEIEDSLPRIFERVTKKSFLAKPIDNTQPFGLEEMQILKEGACGGDLLKFELVRELLEIERRYRSSNRRSGLMDRLEKAFKKGGFSDNLEALGVAIERKNNKQIITTLRDGATELAEFREKIKEADNETRIS